MHAHCFFVISIIGACPADFADCSVFRYSITGRQPVVATLQCCSTEPANSIHACAYQCLHHFWLQTSYSCWHTPHLGGCNAVAMRSTGSDTPPTLCIRPGRQHLSSGEQGMMGRSRHGTKTLHACRALSTVAEQHLHCSCLHTLLSWWVSCQIR